VVFMKYFSLFFLLSLTLLAEISSGEKNESEHNSSVTSETNDTNSYFSTQYLYNFGDSFGHTLDFTQVYISDQINSYGHFIDDEVYYHLNDKVDSNYTSSIYQDVKGWVDFSDDINSSELNNSDTNQTKIVTNSLHSKKEPTSNRFNDFFKDPSYLNSTTDSFIRLRIGPEYNQQEGTSLINSIQLSLRLPKTEDKLKIFIGEDEDDKVNISQSITEDEAKNANIGVKYYLPTFYEDIKTSFAVGFRGITNPYSRLRFDYVKEVGSWQFRPIQTVEFSAKSLYMEETQLYNDFLWSDTKMIRLFLTRRTEYGYKGMKYTAQLAYYKAVKESSAFRMYTQASGHTDTNIQGDILVHPGVYGFITGFVYREQFFKDYLFYEIEPRVQHSIQYDYKANSIVSFLIEVYFGKI